MAKLSEFMTNEWALIIVACIAAFSSVGTIVITKYYERRFDRVKIKEKQYIDFLSNLTLYKAGYPEAKKAMNECTQVLYLVGNSDVVNSTKEFLEFLMAEGPHPKDKQDALYARLVRAMRSDLYGNKKNITFPDILGLTTYY